MMLKLTEQVIIANMVMEQEKPATSVEQDHNSDAPKKQCTKQCAACKLDRNP
ncbi:hypothetical protein [Paenibacillus montanisoli]|uniref:hypothetical protein n=1 Tax=Paenibacillus montanisoli TaxID=2081970 RepID=UPI0014038EED|nr:hypothetical protein [Paenibacillus montanisoli]